MGCISWVFQHNTHLEDTLGERHGGDWVRGVRVPTSVVGCRVVEVVEMDEQDAVDDGEQSTFPRTRWVRSSAQVLALASWLVLRNA